jgi:hypothetical protein
MSSVKARKYLEMRNAKSQSNNSTTPPESILNRTSGNSSESSLEPRSGGISDPRAKPRSGVSV